MPKETRVCEMFLETKPDLPIPVMKIVPVVLRSVWVNKSVWVWSRFSKKVFRYFCWELKRVLSLFGSMNWVSFS